MLFLLPSIVFTTVLFFYDFSSAEESLEAVRADFHLKVIEAIFANGKQNADFNSFKMIEIANENLSDPITFQILKIKDKNEIEVKINLWGNNASLSNKTALAGAVLEIGKKHKRVFGFDNIIGSLDLIVSGITQYNNFSRGIDTGLTQATVNINCSEVVVCATDVALVMTSALDELRKKGVKSAASHIEDLKSIIKEAEDNAFNLKD